MFRILAAVTLSASLMAPSLALAGHKPSHSPRGQSVRQSVQQVPAGKQRGESISSVAKSAPGARANQIRFLQGR
jgi:hypothetical protein